MNRKCHLLFACDLVEEVSDLGDFEVGSEVRDAHGRQRRRLAARRARQARHDAAPLRLVHRQVAPQTRLAERVQARQRLGRREVLEADGAGDELVAQVARCVGHAATGAEEVSLQPEVVEVGRSCTWDDRACFLSVHTLVWNVGCCDQNFDSKYRITPEHETDTV